MISRIQCGNGNCFLLQENNASILVDTSRTKYRGKILEQCRDANVKLIILTHGHMDHIQNAAYLAKELKVPIAIHKSDYELTKNNMIEPLSAHNLLGKLVLQLSIKSFEFDTIDEFEPTVFLKEGDSLMEYGINATIVGLPGHTKGSIGIQSGEELLVGDALMNLFYPTKSMLYGDREQMEKSAEYISNRNVKMIHFGHGKSMPNRTW
jgi:glyoxylase-like metal-dependent hydrolase (beta-lactamase superfamily II)